MSESKVRKLRVCRGCGVTIRTDARGIKEHAKRCTKKAAVKDREVKLRFAVKTDGGLDVFDNAGERLAALAAGGTADAA